MKSNNTIKQISACLIAVIFYSALIYVIPGYITDDYFIIRIIRENGTFFSHSPNEKFYLFFRPVTYLLFNVDVYLLNNPVYSKMLSLILLIITLIVIGSLIHKFLKLSKRTISVTDYILIMIFFFTNVNIAFSVIWIANRNEILMCLFYFLSIYLYLKYFDNHNNILLILIPFCFLFSVLSKQQSLQLPFILILLRIMFYKNKVLKVEIFVGLILFFVMGTVFLVNSYFMINETEIFLNNLWKKGFWVINSLVYSIVPFWGDHLYNYFTYNKLFAVIILLLIITYLFLFKYKQILRKNYLISLLIYLLTFFPVMILTFSPRSIFLSFALLIPLLHFNIDLFKSRMIARIILTVLILYNVIFTFKFAYTLDQYDSIIEEVTNDFENYIKQNPIKTIVISRIDHFEDRLNAPFLFEQDSLVSSLPIFPINVGYYDYRFCDTSNISVEIDSESINIKSKSDDFCISTKGKDSIIIEGVTLVIIVKEKHIRKHNKSIIIKPINYNKFISEYKLLAYLNGYKWEYIDLSKYR